MINSIKFVNTLTHDKFPPWQCGFAFIAWRDENHNRVIEHNGFGYITEEDVEVLESVLEMVKFKAEENKRFSAQEIETPKQTGIIDRRKTRKWPDNKIKYLYLAGYRQCDIAKALGISKQRVSQFVKDNKLKELQK